MRSPLLSLILLISPLPLHCSFHAIVLFVFRLLIPSTATPFLVSIFSIKFSCSHCFLFISCNISLFLSFFLFSRFASAPFCCWFFPVFLSSLSSLLHRDYMLSMMRFPSFLSFTVFRPILFYLAFFLLLILCFSLSVLLLHHSPSSSCIVSPFLAGF